MLTIIDPLSHDQNIESFGHVDAPGSSPFDRGELWDEVREFGARLDPLPARTQRKLIVDTIRSRENVPRPPKVRQPDIAFFHKSPPVRDASISKNSSLSSWLHCLWMFRAGPSSIFPRKSATKTGIRRSSPGDSLARMTSRSRSVRFSHWARASSGTG